MELKNRPTCEHCDFWEEPEENDDTGLCRKYAPGRSVSATYDNLSFSSDIFTSWTETKKDDWCGEHSNFYVERSRGH